MEAIIPETITVAWVANIVVALLVGFAAGRLLRVAIWLAIVVGAIFVLVQFVILTPTVTMESFFEAEQLAELGKNASELIRSIIPHFKEHVLANTTLLVALVIGFIVSFFGKR